MTPEDEGRINDELRMAGKAREVLENEAFKGAVKSIEEALLIGLRNSAFKDAELREKIAQRYSLLYDLVIQIQSYIETGKMAEEEVKRKTIMERTKELLNIYA